MKHIRLFEEIDMNDEVWEENEDDWKNEIIEKVLPIKKDIVGALEDVIRNTEPDDDELRYDTYIGMFGEVDFGDMIENILENGDYDLYEYYRTRTHFMLKFKLNGKILSIPLIYGKTSEGIENDFTGKLKYYLWFNKNVIQVL